MPETVPSPNGIGRDETAVFKHARDQFLQHLSSEDRAVFAQISSATELLDSFKSFEARFGDDWRWMKMFSAVKVCNDRLQPYFKIIDIIAQSHPAWATIAWGAFRLILQVASNFTGFFEKLADILLQVTSHIPAYSDILRLNISDPSNRFRLSLTKFYEDLLQFFQAVLHLFTQRNGRLKRTPIVISQLLWRPFELRFKNFLSRLEFHKEILRLEIDVLQLTSSQSFFRAWRQERVADSTFRAEARRYFELVEEMKRTFSVQEREKLISAIMVWLNAPKYADSYEKSIATREHGTAKWLFDADAFTTWRDTWNDPSKGVDWTRILWIAGNPGSGKTVLAASCVQELRKVPQNASSTSSSTVYFFFEAGRPGASKWNDALRAILAQVLLQTQADDTVLDLFAIAMSSARNEGQSIATYNDMMDLINSLVTHLGRIYFFLDGIDESDTPDEILLNLWKLRTIHGLRILLFSRPNVGFLRRNLKSEQIIDIKSVSQAKDIAIYVRRQLEGLCDLGLLPRTAAIEQQVDKILLGADGMFLWASLMISHLKSPAFSCSQRISIISSLEHPEKLDQMYERIVQHFARGPRHEQTFTRQILLWLAYGELPLTCCQLKDIMWPQTTSRCHDDMHSLTDETNEFENSVIVLCGGLVEFRYTRCYFTHQSAWEYVRSRCSAGEASVGAEAGSIEYFFPPPLVAKTEQATTCLSYIKSRAIAGPLSGSINQRASALLVSDFMPFLNYAALAWTGHLTGTLDVPRPTVDYHWPKFRAKFEDLLRLLAEFLQNRITIMSWIEALYTFAERLSEGTYTKMFSDLLAWANRAETLLLDLGIQSNTDLLQKVAAFSRSMMYLLKYWDNALSDNPNLIWAEVTAFTENPFLQRSSAIFTEELGSTASHDANNGVEPLARISRLHDEAELCAVLTILPSSHFRDHRIQTGLHTSHEALRELSLGWTAQFEVYNTNPQNCRIEEEWKFDLDPEQVMQQIQNFSKLIGVDSTRSADRSARKDLALHFPISIGNKLEVFTVLRKVYTRKSFGNVSDSIPNKSTQCWYILDIPIEHSGSSTVLHCIPQSFSEQEAPEADVSTWTSTSLRIDDLTAFRFVAHNEYVLYCALRGTSITRNSGFWRNIEDLEHDSDSFTSLHQAYVERCQSHPADSLEQEVSDFETNESGYNIPEQGAASNNDYYIDVDLEDERSISDQSDTVPETESMASSIAVFRIVGAQRGEKVCLLDYLKNAGNWKYIVRCAFHPKLPLLVFHSVSECSGKIILWNFRSFECSTHKFEATPRFETLVETNLCWTESLQFSSCGQQVIFEEYAAACPTIIPVSQMILYQMAQELGDPPTQERSAPESVAMQPVPLAGEMLLSQTKMILHTTASSTRLDFHPSSMQSDVDLVKTSKDSQIVQPLISLPKLPGIQHANVNILPKSDKSETMIRMIITKSPQLFCSLSDASNDTSPVIVGKEAQVLSLARKRKLDSVSSHVWQSLPPILSKASSIFETATMIQAPIEKSRLPESKSKRTKS